jgi:phosphopantetheine adenylyltransferase
MRNKELKKMIDEMKQDIYTLIRNGQNVFDPTTEAHKLSNIIVSIQLHTRDM